MLWLPLPPLQDSIRRDTSGVTSLIGALLRTVRVDFVAKNLRVLASPFLGKSILQAHKTVQIQNHLQVKNIALF